MTDNQLIKNLLASSISISTSVSLFNPLDCLRIKWQTNKKNISLSTFTNKLIKQKSFYTLGIYSNIIGCAISRGIGMGFYPFILNSWSEKTATSMFCSGLISGSIGYGLSNPFWIIKTRQQATNQYKTIFRGLKHLYHTKSLFQGFPYLVVRGGLMNAGNTLGYDGTKTFLKKHNICDEGIILHLFASFNAALLSTTFSVPFDYLLTSNLTNNKCNYKHIFKGWIPMFSRILPIYCLYLPFYEQLRVLFGLNYL